MKKLSLLTSLLVCFVMAAFIFVAVSIKSGTTSRFMGNGFVISSGEDDSNVNYFNVETKYSNLSNDAVSFKTTNGEKAIVDNASFVHYEDGSISAMSDGVVTELNEGLASGLTSTYYVHKETLLLNKGKSYQIQNGNDSITFNNLLYKLNHNKYLVASKDMKLNLPNNNVVNVKDFLEITYVDNGVVYLSNGEHTWTTVSLDSNLELSNGIKFNFMTREITLNDSVIMQLNRFLVNATDSVEILPFQDGNFTIPKINIEGKDGEKGHDGTDGDDGIDGSRGVSGSGGASGSDGETGVQPGENLKLPVFKITNLRIENTSITFNIPSAEPRDMLVNKDHTEEIKQAKIYIYENKTNKLVSGINNPITIENDMLSTNIGFENLKPGTEYRIVLRSEYFVNDEKLSRDFLSKIYTTTEYKVNISLAERTSDLIRLNLSTYASDTQNVTAHLFDSASKAQQFINEYQKNPITGIPDEKWGIVDTKNKSVSSKDVLNISFNNLISNHEYAIVTISNNIINNDYYAVETLKKAPTLLEGVEGNVPIARENRKIYGFDLTLPILKDVDNSITKVEWNVYNYVAGGNPYDKNGTLVKTIKNDYDGTNITPLYVDDVSIKKWDQDNTTNIYFADVTITYFDNDKEVEWNLGNTTSFKMDKSKLPIVTYVVKEPDPNINSSTAGEFYNTNGELHILDVDNTIQSTKFEIRITSSNRYYFAYEVDASHGQGEYIVHNPFTDVTEFGSQYVIDVYAIKTKVGGTDKYKEFVGSTVVNVPKIEPIKIEWSDITDSSVASYALKRVGFKFVKSDLAPNDTEFKKIMSSVVEKVDFELFYNEITSSGTKPRVISTGSVYLSNGEWYLDPQCKEENKLEGSGNEYHVLTIGLKDDDHNYVFNNVNEAMIQGKTLYVRVVEANDKSYDGDRWIGSLNGKIVATDDWNGFSANPYKRFVNQVPIEGEEKKIVDRVSIPLPLTHFDGNKERPAVNVEPFYNKNLDRYNRYGLSKIEDLSDNTIVGYTVSPNIIDKDQIFTSYSYYMMETKKFNNFNADLATYKDVLLNDPDKRISTGPGQYINLETDLINSGLQIDPITVGMYYNNHSSDFNKQEDKDLWNYVLAYKTIPIDYAQEKINNSVLFLLMDEPAGGKPDDLKNIVFTGQDRGFSYTFGMTADIDLSLVKEITDENSERSYTSTYPYASDNYTNRDSLQRSMPVFPKREKADIIMYPFEYSKDSKKMIAKYYIGDIDNSLERDINNQVDVFNIASSSADDFGLDIGNSLTAGEFETFKPTDPYSYNKIIVDDPMKSNVKAHNLLVDTIDTREIAVKEYNFDTTTYGNGGLVNRLDLGKRYATTDQALIYDDVKVYQNRTILYSEEMGKMKLADTPITNVSSLSSENSANILSFEIDFANVEDIDRLAMLEFTFSNETSSITLRPTTSWERSDITSIIVNIPTNEISGFAPGDVLDLSLKAYFHSGEVGLAYYNKSSADVPYFGLQRFNYSLGNRDYVRFYETPNGGAFVSNNDASNSIYTRLDKNSDSSSYIIDKVNSDFTFLYTNYDKQFDGVRLAYKSALNDTFIVNMSDSSGAVPITQALTSFTPRKKSLDKNRTTALIPSKIETKVKDFNKILTLPTVPITIDLINKESSKQSIGFKMSITNYDTIDKVILVLKDKEAGGKLVGNPLTVSFTPNSNKAVETEKILYENLLPNHAYELHVFTKYDAGNPDLNEYCKKYGSGGNNAIFDLTTKNNAVVNPTKPMSVSYIARNYNEKILSVEVYVDNTTALTPNYGVLKIVDTAGNLIYQYKADELSTTPITPQTFNYADELKKNSGVILNHNTKYNLVYEIYEKNPDITAGQEPLSTYPKSGQIQPSFRTPANDVTVILTPVTKYDSANEEHYITIYPSIGFEDKAKSVVNDEFALQITELEVDSITNEITKRTPILTKFYNETNNNSISNVGFDSRTILTNESLKENTYYEITVHYVEDITNNGKFGDGNPLKGISNYSNLLEKYNPDASKGEEGYMDSRYFKHESVLVKTKSSKSHDTGEFYATYRNGNMDFHFGNSNNVYNQINSIEYSVNYFETVEILDVNGEHTGKTEQVGRNYNNKILMDQGKYKLYNVENKDSFYISSEAATVSSQAPEEDKKNALVIAPGTKYDFTVKIFYNDQTTETQVTTVHILNK